MKLTTTDIANRNKAIVKDFATGNFTKAALARKYGVDEKTIRRAIKAAGAVAVAKPATVAKDVKASVKKKAQAATGAKKFAKASTGNSVSSQFQAAPTQKGFKVGDRVQMSDAGKNTYTDSFYNPHTQSGVVNEIQPNRLNTIGVLWDNGRLNVYQDKEIQLVQDAVETSTVKATMQSGGKVEYVITGDSIMLTLGDDVEIVDSTHQNYRQIKKAIVEENFKEAYDLMNVSKAITSFTKGAITVQNGELYYGEMQLKSTLVTRILDLMGQGDEGYKRLVNFLERLLKNPSKQSVQELWGFVSHLDVEIDEDGFIIGWKKVQSKGGRLFDSYTGRVPNDVGNIVEMPRHMVNDNRDQTCSQGLHVGAWDYVKGFSGDTITKVKVDPADVVSVPTDYNDMKMRAAKYVVLDVVNGKKEPIDFKRDASVKCLHVVVGERGELLEQTEI